MTNRFIYDIICSNSKEVNVYERRLKMKIKSDEKLNPVLRNQVQTLRCMINKGVNSERFIKTPCSDCPAVYVTDIETGRKTAVSLFALSEVMDALKDLFE